MQNMERNVMSYQQIDSRPSKARIKSPPLSGGEVARKTEEKGRGLSERSEFRRPRRRLRRQTQKPDNRGGASWFVLLAAEKNEQINDLFQPLSSETAVPSVSPLYFPTETQGRRLNSSCSPHKNTRPQKKKNPLLPIF